ncbi:hypothetical protein GCM10018791_23680 [Streptomyces zaomyceticus]|nr:hypothetical protein GCM10018791_23680 [Streptomyces zaomyceticus]
MEPLAQPQKVMVTGPEGLFAVSSPLPPHAVSTARAVAVPAMTRDVLLQLRVTARLLGAGGWEVVAVIL